MNEQIKAIAQRLKGLRDAIDATAEEFALSAEISTDQYLEYESGKVDIPVSLLHSISKKYGIEMTALLFGEDARVSSYCLTRKGQGTAMERSKAYKYQALVSGFKNRKADPFIVTVEPKDPSIPISLNAHPGQEFNMILQGEMQLQIGNSLLSLSQGDSILFDATQPHGMKTLDNQPVKFLAIIL